MNKRGQILRTFGYIVAAIGLVIFITWLLMITGYIGEKRKSSEEVDFEYYIREINDLQNKDLLKLKTGNGNYTFKLYSPGAKRPPRCGVYACACVFQGDATQVEDRLIACEALKSIANDCSEKYDCLKTDTMAVYKKPPLKPETIFFCKKNGQITITLKESEC